MKRMQRIMASSAISVLGAGALSPAQAHEPVLRETDLVSNLQGRAKHTDPNLKNPWGLVPNPTGIWWIANNGTGVSTLVNELGVAQPEKSPLVVSLEADPAPTGIVFNDGRAFEFSDSRAELGSASFIFATEGGLLEAWSPAVPPPAPSSKAFIVVDNSTKGCSAGESDCGAVYKGLAIATLPSGEARLYATDFRNAHVDVLDDKLQPVDDPKAFVDSGIPAGYAPFGIAHLHEGIFVTYAKQNDDKEDDVPGPGKGFVDEFDMEGHLVRRVASGGELDAPWGLAFAPDAWSGLAGGLLVGNFGDGKINAYAPDASGSFKFAGALQDENSRPIVIDGLWAIVFGNLPSTDSTLFFTAGLNDEADGLFGTISLVP